MPCLVSLGHFFSREPAPRGILIDGRRELIEISPDGLIGDQLIHDTHHPISGGLYFEDQRGEAKRRTTDFLKNRAPKFLHYFERVLERSGGTYLLGRKLTYADLSLFQIVEGLRYAFPKAMTRLERKIPGVVALHDRVAKRPRIAAYLASERRIGFNEQGIFRYYKELDA